MEFFSANCVSQGCSYNASESMLALGLISSSSSSPAFGTGILAASELPSAIKSLPDGARIDMKFTSSESLDSIFNNAATDADTLTVAYTVTCHGGAACNGLTITPDSSEVESEERTLDKVAARKFLEDEALLVGPCAEASDADPDLYQMCAELAERRHGMQELFVSGEREKNKMIGTIAGGIVGGIFGPFGGIFGGMFGGLIGEEIGKD